MVASLDPENKFAKWWLNSVEKIMKNYKNIIFCYEQINKMIMNVIKIFTEMSGYIQYSQKSNEWKSSKTR